VSDLKEREREIMTMIKCFVIGILVGAASFMGMAVITTGLLLTKAQQLASQREQDTLHSWSDEDRILFEESKTMVHVHPSTPEEVHLRHPSSSHGSPQQQVHTSLYQNPTRRAAFYHWEQFLSVWQTNPPHGGLPPRKSTKISPTNHSNSLRLRLRLQSWMQRMHLSVQPEEEEDDHKTDASQSHRMDQLVALHHLELASEGGHPEAQ
jgi:hypothetical protein